jgi:predicted Zn-dependent protease
MKINTLIFLSIGSALLAACSSPPPNPVVSVQPIIFEEPPVSAPFYALNPENYTKPPEFEVHLSQAALAPVQALRVKADPNNPQSQEIVLDKNRLLVPLLSSNHKNIRYGVLAQANELDVTEIDDFLNLLEGKARHYPAHFTSAKEQDGFSKKLQHLINQLDPLAANPDASYDVLIRAAKASGMARNLDMGDIYGPKALGYAKRLLAMQPNDPTTSFWLGFGLAEGGGFKEGLPYLKTAMAAGIQEAYLSAANTYLFMDQKKNAITTLKNYKVLNPSEAKIVDQLIKEIQAGQRYNVWQVVK